MAGLSVSQRKWFNVYGDMFASVCTVATMVIMGACKFGFIRFQHQIERFPSGLSKGICYGSFLDEMDGTYFVKEVY